MLLRIPHSAFPTLEMTNPSVSVKKYLAIWGWLAGLMLLGVVLSELHILPFPTSTVILIVVVLSTIKALLVALYYMHLKSDRWLLALIAVAPLLLIALVLGLLFSSRLVRL